MAVHARRDEEYDETARYRPVETVPAPPAENSRYRLARRIVYYALDIIEVLLGFRFVLKAFGANTASPFVQFIYGASSPFALPFQGIFPDSSTGSAAVLEWSTLVAMVVYLLVAIGLVRLLRLIIKGGRPAPPEERL